MFPLIEEEEEEEKEEEDDVWPPMSAEIGRISS
jgi:hypothetical protein